MLATSTPSNVFLLHVAPQSNVTREAFEQALFFLTRCFVVPACPHVAPSMFSHRLLRDDHGGHYIWEIVLDGVESTAEDASTEPLDQAVRTEIEAALKDIGELQSFAAYTSVEIPAPYIDVPPVIAGDTEFSSFGSEEIPWTEYASDSGSATAGQELPESILKNIEEFRSQVPVEPNLKPYGKGHVYFALEDKAHRAWLSQYFDAKMAPASADDKRKIRAFSAFQTREGTTASINTYDNQIVTWGTGWGGLGWLGPVMTRATANNAVRAILEQAGVRYRTKNTYDIVDLKTKRVVTGKQEALEVMRASVPLLNLLIKLARAPETRDAVADAQLGTFFISAGDVSSANEMATQALFNMVSHLKHWAPGYATGCLEWAAPQLAGQAVSPERDKLLARLVGHYFYGKARGKGWIPDWKQFQGYWRHMKEDGLDCLSDPFIQAASYPTDDPFVATPLPTAAKTTTAAPTKAPAQTTAAPAQTTAAPAKARILTRALSRYDQLESIAAGKGLLRRGAQGTSVQAVQQVLLHLGCSLPAGANGIFDVAVERAVQAFQRAHGLGDDGVIGAKSIKKLDDLSEDPGAKT